MNRRVVVTAAEAVTAAGIGRYALAMALRSNQCVGSAGAYQLPIERVARVLSKVSELAQFPDDR